MSGFLDTSWMLDEEVMKKYTGSYTMKALGILAFLFYFIFLFSLTVKDDTVLSGPHIAIYLVATIIPLLLFSFFILSSVKDTKYLGLLALLAIFFFLAIIRAYIPSFSDVFYWFLKFITEVTPLPGLSTDYSFLVLIFFKLLMIFIVLIGLSIFYNVFLNEGYRQNGPIGFLLYFLFFIPCLISDYVAYLFQELGATPVVVYFLIGLEVLLVFLYFLLPKLLRRLKISTGTQIIKNPTYFYGYDTVSDVTPFLTGNTDIYSNDYNSANPEDLNNITIRREYAISMWITTNEPTFGREDCMMFRFGKEGEQHGCPYISCTKEGKWKFVVSNLGIIKSAEAVARNYVREVNKFSHKPSSEITYQENNDERVKQQVSNYNARLPKVTAEFVVPMQRWNNVVLNYHNTEVDIFINGELLETIYLEGTSLPIYDNAMEVSVGSNTSELHGAICNVTVYPEILSTTQISQTYNILRLQNPPVYNVM